MSKTQIELAHEALKKTFNLESFRPLQEEIIIDILNGRDLLVLMPTGGGKSLCFQLPAIIMPGLTVVVSPLISLIFDQILGLRELGIPAFFWNSQTTLKEKQEILKNLRSDPNEIPESERCKLFYTTPETLTTNFSVMDLLNDLNKSGRLNRFVIDEAHCLSNWGHEFRPSYLELKVLKKQYPETPIAAFTATAVPKVQMDIIKQANLQKPKIYRQSFVRPNITYIVKARKNGDTQTLEEVADWIRDKYPDGSGIIYCLSRKKCEETAMELLGMGISADYYHAQIPANKKNQVQEGWLKGKIKVIVATIAFALGINKSDVRYVIHLSMPKSIEGYYQETGRAGRDRLESECILYYSIQDKIILESMIKKEARAKSESPVSILGRISQMYDYCTNLVDCRKLQMSQYLGEHIIYSCQIGCDNCIDSYPTRRKSIASAVDTILRCLIDEEEPIAADSEVFLQTLTGMIREFNRTELIRISRHLLQHGVLENRAYLTKGTRKICEVLKIGPKILNQFNSSCKLEAGKIMAGLDTEILEMSFRNESKMGDFSLFKKNNSISKKVGHAKSNYKDNKKQNKNTGRSYNWGREENILEIPVKLVPSTPKQRTPPKTKINTKTNNSPYAPFFNQKKGKKYSPSKPYPDFCSKVDNSNINLDDPKIVSLKHQFGLN